MDIKALLGVTLGTCTLERVIGHGGMGAVYLAQQSRPVRTVAVKVLIPANNIEIEQREVFLARFRREADTVAKLEHKNILPIYEYDEAVVGQEKVAYLVMPFIRGGTLRERIDETNRSGSYIDLQLVASYISQVADALDYAHSLGVVHRDIKPGNLLFHLDGRLLLGDFGIVHLKAMPALTSVGSFLGTAEYASPEQISSNEIDFRSDIYSLGTILFELLTGSVPCTGPNPFAVMAQKMRDALPSVRDYRPDLSPAIEAVVTKALAKNPADRFQSASAMAADLRAAINSGSPLHLSGDGNNIDMTVAERPWGAVSPLVAALPASSTQSVIPPTQPAMLFPTGAFGGAAVPWQQQPGQWPSQQAQDQAQSPVGMSPANAGSYAAPSYPYHPQDTQATGAVVSADVKQYREGKRLFYYIAALLTLLTQFLIIILINPLAKAVPALNVMMGLLLGCGLNFMILAAMGLTSVVRARHVRKFIYRALTVAIITPILSGAFISFGMANSRFPGSLYIIAYLVLLASNLYLMRQLSHVDVGKEQIEVAPVLWRPASAGALTGLLPLTIMMIFALPAFFTYPTNSLPWLDILGVLFVIFIAIPTPGAMLAVWLSAKMSFATLARSSAIAGMLMFLGAFLLVVLWHLIFSSHSPIFGHLNQAWVALLIIASVSSLVGALRGMLDAWLCRRFLKKK
ncbi:MAG: serine/threonine protein kinase [Chloroflexota bacterium]|nr:serine/threonine protein kinase [Chloroflexota bacterium]